MERLALWRKKVEDFLEMALPAPAEPPAVLHQAMRHALRGGKRLRPALVFAAYEAIAGADAPPWVNQVAGAVEALHAYSLVHDDLPAMDDAQYRHGLPAVHRQYGEATAILVGDALQALAFQWLGEAPWPSPHLGLRAVVLLGRAAGSLGLVGGQQDDLSWERQAAGEKELESLYRRKTGCLLEASLLLGGLAAGAGPAEEAWLRRIAGPMGLGYQVADDVLDVAGNLETLGKDGGLDEERGRVTYVTLLGLEGAREKARRLFEIAGREAFPLGERAQGLLEIIAFMGERLEAQREMKP
ncbi:MAG: polyprenyl synthetase family protein [Bacillota bacterium]|nr:polyprenyl synthetase family protein [Bacillota bacterium]